VIARLERRRVHHRPAGPPLSVRLVGALTRCALLTRAVLGVRTGRVLLVGVLGTVATGLVLAVPVISVGTDTATLTGPPPSALDSSSSSASSADVPASPDGGSRVARGVGERPSASAPPTTTGAPSSPTSPTTSQTTPQTTEATTEAPTSAGTVADAPASTGAGSPQTSSTESAGSAPEPEPAVESAPPAVPGTPEGADFLLGLLDRARAEAGCDPLSVDSALAGAAQAHSAAMRDEGDLDLPDGDSLLALGASAGAVASGESDAHDVLDDWLDDEDDDAAIRDCGLVSVGIGRADGDDGPWWTLLLA
jgi:uncharacterized protein YkwD